MRLRISLRSVAKSLSTTTLHARPSQSTDPVRDLVDFFRQGRPNITLLTGAGVSTDSNVPDYRGPTGTYTLNPGYQPIFYQNFVNSDESRRRYWARSFLGVLNMMQTSPNPTHYACSALQSPAVPPTCAPVPGPSISGSVSVLVPGSVNSLSADQKPYVGTLITQNVDGLHQKAGAKDVIELHGTLHRVKCLNCGHEEDRSDFQETLAALNPEWDLMVKSQSSSTLYSRMNADGDVELKTVEQQAKEKEQTKASFATLDYRSFQYPSCPCCGTGIYKPSVVFFGENIPTMTKERASEAVLGSNGLLVIGTSLATYSAFRLVKLAKEAGVPVAMVNLGRSRGDDLADIVCDGGSSEIMVGVATALGLGPIAGKVKKYQPKMNVIGS
ncbi:NAD-dependent protein lipoamidase sirtuin-4 [Gryganskiella cystojenkinii]|nr:NAD-dependent protein lipoamidase sirtuin-4 [Gryganskiella cystojenkinii]